MNTTPIRFSIECPGDMTVSVSKTDRQTIVISFEASKTIQKAAADNSNQERTEALSIASQWAAKRIARGQGVNKECFLSRARSERKSRYLQINRMEIWDQLEVTP